MKTKLLLIAIACLLLGLTTPAFAQIDTLHTPAMRQAFKNAANQEMISFWNGNVSIIRSLNLLQNDHFREGLGITEKQVQTIQEATWLMATVSIVSVDGESHIVANDPDIQLIQDEISKLQSTYAENVSISEETGEKIFDLHWTLGELVHQKASDIINENLTPDQLRKTKEFHLSVMSEIPFVTPSMFEVLDLSDEQKEQLASIKEEMEAEFLELIDKMGEMQLKMSEKFQEELAKLEVPPVEGVPDIVERMRLADEIGLGKKVSDANPDLWREWGKISGTGSGLADKLKVKMFDVLTDEQWARMIDLIDNPPDYAKRWIVQNRGYMEGANSEASGWVPGPGSWQPGDPIPIQYRQERETRGRFPRGE